MECLLWSETTVGPGWANKASAAMVPGCLSWIEPSNLVLFHGLWCIRIRGLWKILDGRDWLWGKLGLVLMGRAMLSKSLIQFSFDVQSCVPSLLFDLMPNYGGGNETMETSFIRFHAGIATVSAPDPTTGHHQPTPPPETPGHSQASLSQSLVESLLLSPGSCCTQGFVCALQEPLIIIHQRADRMKTTITED